MRPHAKLQRAAPPVGQNSQIYCFPPWTAICRKTHVKWIMTSPFQFSGKQLVWICPQDGSRTQHTWRITHFVPVKSALFQDISEQRRKLCREIRIKTCLKKMIMRWSKYIKVQIVHMNKLFINNYIHTLKGGCGCSFLPLTFTFHDFSRIFVTAEKQTWLLFAFHIWALCVILQLTFLVVNIVHWFLITFLCICHTFVETAWRDKKNMLKFST